MTIGRIRASILVAGLLVVAMTASSADAVINPDALKCMLASAKASQKFTIAKLKVYEKCKNAALKDGSTCTPDTTKVDGKLTSALGKSCAITASLFQTLGFPGPCSDPNLADGFTTSDLQSCMQTAHDAFVTSALDLIYDPNVSGPLGDDLKCQAEVAKQVVGYSACVLKNVSKCRDANLKGKTTVPPDYCATADPKVSAAIQKCRDKLEGGIDKKCSDTQIQSLKICTPDQTDKAGAVSCLLDAITVQLDGTEITVPPDLIDYEYAVRGGLCGDNIVNNLNEECDGTDDSACPNQCGTAENPDGFFACLCKTKPRMVIVEHANADTDNGWKGVSVDGSVVEGGGFLVDLYDCDGMTGLCIAGPNCSLAPHSPCGVPDNAPSGTTSDSICAGLGQGTCRKERTATGPHCYQDINKKCDLKNASDPVCNAPGDYCQTSFHGAPVSQAAGGVAVCNVSTFSEDVVGTANLIDGTSSLKVRQRAVTRNAIQQYKPCPLCGNFCALDRNPCDVDADCAPGQGPCITQGVCSDGARKDKSCRQTAPFAGELPYFGRTSVDCGPNTGPITNPNGNGLDINANPRTTGTVTLLPSFNCTAPGFNGKACLGGTSEGRPCTVASECPGGTCTGQCFCSGEGQPNTCDPACVGDVVHDAQPCDTDADCGSGFCHKGDCRVDPNDHDSNQEGICTATTDTFCVLTPNWACSQSHGNADCQPSPACPFCVAGDTCQARPRACFVNSGIIRIGTPGVTDRETAAVYCVPGNGGGIDLSAGFPGPGALIQREHILVTP